MEITSKKLKRCDLVKVSGRIDSNTAPDLEEELKAITDAERFRIVLDMADVNYISSAGLRVLISFLKLCKRWNRGNLYLAAMPPRILNVLDLAGITMLFKAFDTDAEAVGNF